MLRKFMLDTVVTITGLLIAGGALLALQHWLANIDRRRAEMTDEEYEEYRGRDAGLLGAGMMAIDQTIFRRSAERAIEFRIDAEQGQLPGGGGGQGEKLYAPKEESEEPTS